MFSPLINNIFKKRLKKIDFFTKHSDECQKTIFQSLIKSARNTAFGREHYFHKINQFEDFQSKVPVRTYEQIYPYVERIRNGESNVLWHSSIRWFAKSSGTTNDRSKYIPVSQESLQENHLKAGKDFLATYIRLNPESKIFSPFSRSLVLGGSQKVIEGKGNYRFHEGDISAVIVKNLPAWTNYFREPDNSITLMDNYEEKIEEMAQVIKDKNITHISGVPTWMIVLAKRVLELTGKSNLNEVWPNLELFMHGAVNFDPYRESFHKLIPKASMNYLETYNASEGFFAFQNDFSSNEMLLLTQHGIFYEFIPLEEVGKDFPVSFPLSQIELETPYAMLISTNSGLWRYNLGDTVVFKSKNPYKLRILGRTKQYINAFGEELMIENAEQALKLTCKETQCEVVNFTACPIYFSDKNAGAHQWLIEFEKEPENPEHFAEQLDKHLRSINSDYDAKRTANLALERLKMNLLPKGTFYQWMKKRNKLGGQNKVPRLSNNRDYVDDILNMLE